ncbi:MAG: hypothetical protein ABR510_10755 [Trueperaceae bacterium]
MAADEVQPDERHRARTARARPRAASARPRGSRAADLALVLLLGMAAVQAYALLHEVGQGLAAWAVGASVVGFDAWALGRPNVRLAGDLSGARGAWVAVGGALWTWATTLLVMYLVRPRARLLRLGALLWTSVAVAALLPWVVVPLAAAPRLGDDVATFLQLSGALPIAVAAVAALAVLLLVLAAARSVGGPRGAWQAARATEGLGRRPWPWAAVVGSVLLVILATEGGGRFFGGPATVLPPLGFIVAAEVGLRAGIGDDQLVGDFAEAPHVLEVWVAVEGADRGPIVVEIVAPSGARTSVLRLPVRTPVGRATARSAPLQLPAGPWSVVASAPRGEGRLVVGWRGR